MKTMDRIVIATDFSKNSDNAVIMGKNILQKQGGEAILVHISDVSPVWDWPASDLQAKNLLGQFRKEINDSLNKLMKEQLLRCDVDFKCKIAYGNSHKELLNAITTLEADLLIIGHRGQTGLFKIGSLAEKMIATSPVPVLVARNGNQLKKIACLIDLSKISEEAITCSKDLERTFDSKTSYVTSVPDLTSASSMNIPLSMPAYKFSDDEKNEIKTNVTSEIIKRNGDIKVDEIRVEISSLPTAENLSAILSEMKTDLAIISKHNRGAIEKYFIGSVSKGVLHHFEGNILVLPDQA